MEKPPQQNLTPRPAVQHRLVISRPDKNGAEEKPNGKVYREKFLLRETLGTEEQAKETNSSSLARN